MDHGTQYTADDVLNQIRSVAVPSFTFVAEPQTNGVAERFNRTIKEQVIYGRIFRNLQEVRTVVTEFKGRYNRHWRLEKLGFKSPLEARQAIVMQEAALSCKTVQKMPAGTHCCVSIFASAVRQIS
jgi:transposase InsO family protein